MKKVQIPIGFRFLNTKKKKVGKKSPKKVVMNSKISLRCHDVILS